MGWFGFDEKAIGEKSVEEARKMVAETVDKLEPLFAAVANRATVLAHGILDRFRFKVDIQVELQPDQTRYPKAEKKGQL
jgi:hypothetical protein